MESFGSRVVELSRPNPRIEGSNAASGAGREFFFSKIRKNIIIKR